MPPASEAPGKRSPLESFLGLFTEVRAGEGVTAVLLTVNVFLLLTSYYFIKPVREALILAMRGGAEYKSYMGGAIAVALLFAVPAYARVARRLPRNRLVVGVTLFFVSHLVVFYALSAIEAVQPYLGLLFFLWVGIFNMMVVAQFWAFANDVYSEEQGKRLFPLVGVGASTGAVAGSWLAGLLTDREAPLVDVYTMLLLSAGLLAVCALLSQLVHARESSRVPEAPPEPKAADKPKRGAFAMVLRHRYLWLIAVFSLLFTFVNTNGEYMLGRLISGDAKVQAKDEVSLADAVAWLAVPENEPKAKAYFEANQATDFAGLTFEGSRDQVAQALLIRERTKALISGAFSDFFFWVNLFGVLLQMFVVSRLVKYAGFKASFFVFPVIALADAVAMVVVPALAVLRIGKTAENATDYSLNNTLRNMLWLPTTKDMKYLAKQAVDTFFVRMGDVSSALLVALGAYLAWEVRAFAVANVALVAMWLVVAGAILKAQVALKAQRAAGQLED
ncbi:MAG: MFS transporter [Myxococcales bacterium]|nr:MFS transporter [Myxococcales bacterium]